MKPSIAVSPSLNTVSITVTVTKPNLAEPKEVQELRLAIAELDDDTVQACLDDWLEGTLI